VRGSRRQLGGRLLVLGIVAFVLSAATAFVRSIAVQRFSTVLFVLSILIVIAGIYCLITASLADNRASRIGWRPDPTGEHEFRYHDGGDWTAWVSDNGQVSDSSG